MARTATLPVLNGESGLSRYLAEIRKFPMLEPQQEYMLAKRWREHDDRDAAHQLVTSHLRLVAKIAMGYRGYGLPISEVVSEGNVGLMQAVKRFEPDKGFRLATYAMWWIKASIQEYILRSWSLVKMGTTANQKKLFFNLRKAKSKISALGEGDLRPDQVKQIALYSDCLGEGHWSEPAEVIGGPLAQSLVACAQLLARGGQVTQLEIELWVEHVGPHLHGPRWRAEQALEAWYAEMQRHGLAPSGPNSMARFVRAGADGEPPAPAACLDGVATPTAGI